MICTGLSSDNLCSIPYVHSLCSFYGILIYVGTYYSE